MIMKQNVNNDVRKDSPIKKMAAVHFATIPCEHNTANRNEENYILLGNLSLY